MPGRATGNTWWKTACVWDAPRPNAPSFIEGGTDFSAALLEIIIVGSVIKERTIPPTSGADLGIPKKFKNIAKPNRPNIIEGTAARLFIFTSIKSTNLLFFGANSSKKIAVAIPTGKDKIKVIVSANNEPIRAPRIPACSDWEESPLVNNVLLKNFSIKLLDSRVSIQSSSWLSILLLSSGRFLSMCPLNNMSTSSLANTHIFLLVPIELILFLIKSLNWYSAELLINLYSFLLSLLPDTSGYISLKEFLINLLKFFFFIISHSCVCSGSRIFWLNCILSWILVSWNAVYPCEIILINNIESRSSAVSIEAIPKSLNLFSFASLDFKLFILLSIPSYNM